MAVGSGLRKKGQKCSTKWYEECYQIILLKTHAAPK